MGGIINTTFKKASVELLVLNFVNKEDTYGYEIVNEITKYYSINEKTVYPILHRLMKNNYLSSYTSKSDAGPNRKYYQITALGKEKLNIEANEFIEYSKKIIEVLERDNDE